MASSSRSGPTFKLHPLVIVNISDHYTRVKAQTQRSVSTGTASSSLTAANGSAAPRVFGCVIGEQRGRTVEIFNSFEMILDPISQTLDRAFLEKKQELYKKVFPNFYILGWYSTGNDAEESDMQIHKALMDINESPVYVLLNPAISHAKKDLPVTIFETVAAHLTGIHSAIKMLNSRIRIVHQYLLAMQRGDVPLENSLLRQVSSLLRRLPAMESEKFQDDFLMEFNDTLLMTYLAMFTNCASTMNELVEKFSTIYDRHSRRGGRTSFI
ncbi:hypothetical protein KFK09_014937 [Dendrobium nobile]|uniref:COP9 signalosome complex subunit 6 n=1 Tax=Dendrobium nobile TaxID=94219 RepID=A0A8T3B3F3_DENNO|nr:hypothetical protein KFK09_014937 [Dendrobium nobile]